MYAELSLQLISQPPACLDVGFQSRSLMVLQDTSGGGSATPGDLARSDTQLWPGSAVWPPPHLPVPTTPAHPLVRLWHTHQEHTSHTEGMAAFLQ